MLEEERGVGGYLEAGSDLFSVSVVPLSGDTDGLYLSKLFGLLDYPD